MVKNKKLLIILWSLIMAAAVSAAPTMIDCNKNLVTADISRSSDSHFPYITETNQITDISNHQFEAIGAEILKPPDGFTDLQSIDTKTLPPVPATLFMALTGFLCVSFVKDRRIWLAALAGLLWAGQAGIQAIPQLAVNISKKHIQQTSPANTVCLSRFVDSNRLRSDIEGTQYIGLLHYLAGIPKNTMSLPLYQSLGSLRVQQSNINALLKNVFSVRTKSNIAEPQFAIIDFSSLLNPAVICTVAQAEQYICFSPAFIFDNLARGPPSNELRIGTFLMWRVTARRPFEL